jgi:hypothetical protein
MVRLLIGVPFPEKLANRHITILMVHVLAWINYARHWQWC